MALEASPGIPSGGVEDEETVEAMLSSVRLEQYASAVEKEGYVFASDLCEAEPAELEALVETCGMKRPEARRLTKAVKSRTMQGGSASGDEAMATAAATRLAQEARAAKLLEAASQSSKSLQDKSESLDSAQARLAAQQEEYERLQREICAAEAAVEHRRQELETRRIQASVVATKELPALDIGDDAVFAAGPKHLTPSSLGTPPSYPTQTSEGFLLTPIANEYQPGPGGLLTDLPTNTLNDSLPSFAHHAEVSATASKAALADELGDDGMLDLSSSSSSEEEEPEAKGKTSDDDDDDSDVAVNIVSTPPRTATSSVLNVGAAAGAEMPELAEGDDITIGGSNLTEAGRAMLDMKGATSRLGSAQAELAALRAALTAEREAKEAAASELTTYAHAFR